MTNGVNASLNLRLTATDTKAPPIGGAAQQVDVAEILTLLAGNGAVGKSDKMVTQAIDIAASGSSSVNLTTATDAFGVALGMAKVQLVLLTADATNTNDIVVGNGTDPFVFGDAGTDTVAVKPGGALVIFNPDGYPVVASTGDQLKLANSAAGSVVTGSLVVIGRSS